MKKPGMCRSLLVTRLTELNEQLVTIAKLQKMEDESDRSPVLHSKICECAHHTLSTGENKKKNSCNVNTCKTRKRCTCLCKFNKKRMDLEKQVGEGKNMCSHNEVDTREEICIKETEKDKCDTKLLGPQDLEKMSSSTCITRDICTNVNTKNENECIHMVNNTECISMEIPMQDNDKSLGRIQKDLTNEKKQKKDLEERLQCLQKQHLMKLKEDGECQASCLRDALKKAEEQLAQARKETNAVIADRDKLLNAISVLKDEVNDITNKNVSLNCQCQDLKSKLQAVSESETRSCTVVQDEVNHIKCISKQKEEILQAEITELKGLITELTNVTKIQERRICELTNVCKKQQCSLHKKNKILMERGSQIAEMQSLLSSYNFKCTGMQNDIQGLCSSLNQESDVCKHLKGELDRCKDDYNCMLNIKTKIIEEQDETIKKQKRLLQDSERMAQQAATEFEEIRNELVREKETCESLRFALITAEAQLNQRHNVECRNCQSLMMELNLLDQQKQKALATAKEALQKLCCSVKYYQRQLTSERQRCKFLTLQLKKAQEEVQYIKQGFVRRKEMIIRKTNDFLS